MHIALGVKLGTSCLPPGGQNSCEQLSPFKTCFLSPIVAGVAPPSCQTRCCINLSKRNTEIILKTKCFYSSMIWDQPEQWWPCQGNWAWGQDLLEVGLHNDWYQYSKFYKKIEESQMLRTIVIINEKWRLAWGQDMWMVGSQIHWYRYIFGGFEVLSTIAKF